MLPALSLQHPLSLALSLSLALLLSLWVRAMQLDERYE